MDYERMVARHKDAVYRQMVRACGNHEDAEDVLVQALLKAHQSAGSLRRDDAFQAWVAIVGRRICGRMKRQEALAPILAVPQGNLEARAGADPEQGWAEEIDAKACVKSALAAMPQSLRVVLELRDLQDFTAEETAEKLHLSVAAVKSRLHRARALLRQLLDTELRPAC